MPGKIHLVLVTALGAGACALGATAAADAMLGGVAAPADAVLKNASGATVGSVRVEPSGVRRLKITVIANGLPAGFHGLHVHARGVCDPASTDPATKSPFFSAGPHFDLGARTHPDHSGDLPDLLVGADGTGRATFTTDRFRENQLFDADGSSVIVHALPDNQANIPHRYDHAGNASGPDAETLKAGDSGGRIACGVLTRRR